MKTCLKCNTLNDDTIRICRSCGNRFELNNPKEHNSQHSEYIQVESSWQALDIIKKFGSGNLFRWMSLLFLVSAIFTFILNFSMLTALSFAVSILIWIGLYKFNETSRLFSNENFSIKGLRIVRNTLFISLLVNIVQIIYTLNYINKSSVSTNSLSSISSAYIQMSRNIIISALIISIPIIIVYLILLIKTVNSVIKTARTGIPSNYVSMYVIVCNFIMAFFTIFNLLSRGFINFLYNGMNIAYYILFSIILIKYKTEMSSYKLSYEFDNPDLGKSSI